MKLHDLMDDAVGDVVASPERLIATARRRGRRHLRPSPVMGAAAAVTAVALAAAGAAYLHFGHRGTDLSAAAAPTAFSGTTVPATGRSTAAALLASVGDVTTGRYGDISGQSFIDHTFAEVDLSTPTGSGQVMVNYDVDNGDQLSEDDDPARWCRQSAFRNCVTTADGATTVTTADDTLDHLTCAVRFRASVLRVDACAQPGVLSTAQMATIVREPWWGRVQLPIEFAQTGAALDYTEVSSVDQNATPNPSKPAGRAARRR